MFPEMGHWKQAFPWIGKLTRDEWRAYAFLSGYDEITPQNFARLVYLKGENEKLGREALIRVLRRRKPIPPILRRRLAALFSQNAGDDDRCLVIKFRSQKPPSGDSRDRVITYFIGQYIRAHGPKLEAAVRQARTHFGLSRTAIFDALKRDKRAHPDWHSEDIRI